MYEKCPGIFHFVILLSVLFSSINVGFSQSPCPEYFHYMKDEVTGEIYGRIVVPRPPKNVELHIKVSLSVGAALPTKYVGRLELATSKFDAINAVYAGRPLVYNLHFPIRNPIPILTEIRFNGQLYCRGSRATSGYVTTIFLEHTLYPPSVLNLSDDLSTSNPGDYANIYHNRPGINFSPVPTSDSSIRPTIPINDKDQAFMNEPPPSIEFYPQRPISKPEDPPSNDYKNCGRANTAGVHYLIANGDATTPGQWPWLVALFIAKLKFQFQCAGSIITNKHVLTAAHCKFDEGIDVPASAFIVSVGRYHLLDWREEGSQSHEVLHFRAHPDYKNRFSADADLAVVTLRKKVEFTPNIQPVCLWSESETLERIIGLSGYVVGWGKDESGHQYLKEPRMAVAPIVSQEDCLRSDPAYFHSTSNRTFCAGRRDGSGPCNGDSGTGLVMRHAKTGRYHLRGIVSLSLLDKDLKSCDLSQYIVYVDAAKFMNWIEEQIND